MAKPRKRHLQLSLPRVDRNGQRRGVGPRKLRVKQGRPAKGPRSSERHGKREVFRLGTPVHVVMRVLPAFRQLRNDKTYAALRAALLVAARRDNFRVVHISVQARHIHLLVEAPDRLTLASGMQSLQISAAKRLNAAITPRGAKRRRGSVFVDRYHAQLITSPRQARHCLAYVLNNWRHHHEDREGLAREWNVDRYSSAVCFDGWREAWTKTWEVPADYERPAVWPPRA